MWKYPWRYAEGIAICIGLFVVGCILQFLLGSVPLEIFKFPMNIIAGSIYIAFLILLYVIGSKNKYILWFTQPIAAVTVIGGLLVLTIIMGFTKQIDVSTTMPHNHNFISLGFNQMTRAWAFVLLFIYFLMVLGLTTIKRIVHFKKSDTVFVLNHLGLFIALFTAILGSADLQRLRMQTFLKQPEWRAQTDNGELVELPIAIELQDFDIEEYPPKLLLIDNKSGKAQPVGKPQSMLIENDSIAGNLNGWKVQTTQYLPMAALVMEKEKAKYVEFKTHGATSAVYVKAEKGNIQKEGWVSSGNHIFPHHSLTLDSLYSIVMPGREPKKYKSEVILYSKENGKVEKATIEVNKTHTLEGWKIYQVSYDEKMGRWSNVSVFELVKDPWLPYVYFGIILMLLGSLGLFLLAKKEEPEIKSIKNKTDA